MLCKKLVCMMVTFVTFPLHTSHTMSLLLVVVLLLSFHVTYNNGSGDNKRVQELLSTLHTHYRCDTPKEGIVYLEDLSSYTYDPGVEWVPRGVVLKTCSDWSGYCPSALQTCSSIQIQKFNSSFLKIDRIRNKITYVQIQLTNATQCGCLNK